MELALRFFAFRSVPSRAGLDVNEYLDQALMRIATNPNYAMAEEADVFSRTFQFLNEALGDKAFKRWDGNVFSGKFLMSVFEVLATGVSHNVDALGQMDPQERNNFISFTLRKDCGPIPQLRCGRPRDHTAQQAIAACRPVAQS